MTNTSLRAAKRRQHEISLRVYQTRTTPKSLLFKAVGGGRKLQQTQAVWAGTATQFEILQERASAPALILSFSGV